MSPQAALLSQFDVHLSAVAVERPDVAVPAGRVHRIDLLIDEVGRADAEERSDEEDFARHSLLENQLRRADGFRLEVRILLPRCQRIRELTLIQRRSAE